MSIVSSRQVGVKVGWRSRRETIELSLSPEASWIYNATAIAAKISGFITGEGSKTCFKACIVGIDSSFSLAVDVPFAVLPSDMVPPGQSCQAVEFHDNVQYCLQLSETMQLRS